MVRLEIPLGEVADSIAVPAGIYNAYISEVSEQDSKSGNPMLKLVVKIASGEYEGRMIFDYLVLTESALWKLKRVAKATGIESDGVNFPEQDLVNKAIRIKIKNEKYEGEDTAKIESYLEMDGGDNLPDSFGMPEEEFPADDFGDFK